MNGCISFDRNGKYWSMIVQPFSTYVRRRSVEVYQNLIVFIRIYLAVERLVE